MPVKDEEVKAVAVSIDGAINEMVEHAQCEGVSTVWDRYKTPMLTTSLLYNPS